MNTKFTNLIPETHSYHIEKLYDGLHSNSPLAKPNCDYLTKIVNTIREKAIIKYGDLNNLPGLESSLRIIDYILLRINNWIDQGALHDNIDAEIFLDALRYNFKDLVEMMKELDHD